MMRMIGGETVEIPEDGEGRADLEELRYELALPESRALILQNPDGSNILLPRTGKAKIPANCHLLDAPLVRRGG